MCFHCFLFSIIYYLPTTSLNILLFGAFYGGLYITVLLGLHEEFKLEMQGHHPHASDSE